MEIILFELKRKRIYLKILLSLILVFLFSSIIIVSFTTISNLTEKIKKNEYSLVSASMVTNDEYDNFDYDFINDFRSYKLYSSNSFNNTIIIDDYKCNYSNTGFCYGIDKELELLPKNKKIQYNSITNKSLFKIGRNIINDNECVISNSLLKSINISYKNVIGKRLSVSSKLNNVKWIDGLEIVGVLDDSYDSVALNNEGEILVSKNYNNSNSYVRYLTEVYFKDYKEMDKYIEALNSELNINLISSFDFLKTGLSKVESFFSYFKNIFELVMILLSLGLIIYIMSCIYLNNSSNNIFDMINIFGYNELKFKLLLYSFINILSFVISYLILTFGFMISNYFIFKNSGINLFNIKEIKISAVIIFLIIEIVIIFINIIMTRINKNIDKQ